MMAYVNQAAVSSVTERQSSVTSKRELEKLLSLAMTNFVEPTLRRAYKLKSPPLTSVSSVLFLPPPTPCDPPPPGGLLVADPVAGKIVRFDASNGRYHGELVAGVVARDMCLCGADCVAVVDSNEWGSCVKVVSLDSGDVLTTWGRDFDAFTPTAVTSISDAELVISNIHPQATSRLAVFTPDGRQISQFGRAVGPGDLVFRSPVSLAADVTSGRIFAADRDTGCVKMFDTRPSAAFVADFGSTTSASPSTINQTTGATGSGIESSAILDRPVCVRCDSLGNAVVCDSAARRVGLFSRDGRYLCTLIDFRSTTVRGVARWRWPTRQQNGRRDDLVPVCVGLSSPGSRIAVGLEDGGGKLRKLIVYSVNPEL